MFEPMHPCKLNLSPFSLFGLFAMFLLCLHTALQTLADDALRICLQAPLTTPAPVHVLGGSIVTLGAPGSSVTSQVRA